ncbi:unnamed protein product [Gordionus sp. m RMFG-2023]
MTNTAGPNENVKVEGSGFKKTFKINNLLIKRLTGKQNYTLMMIATPIIGNLELYKTVNNTNIIEFIFPRDLKSYNLTFYLTCPNIINMQIIAFNYLKFEDIKNGKIPNHNCSLILVMIANHQKFQITEARKNITYIIVYKTPQMKKPEVKYVINQENIRKKSRNVPRLYLETEDNPALMEGFLEFAQGVGFDDPLETNLYAIEENVETLTNQGDAVEIIPLEVAEGF